MAENNDPLGLLAQAKADNSDPLGLLNTEKKNSASQVTTSTPQNTSTSSAAPVQQDTLPSNLNGVSSDFLKDANKQFFDNVKNPDEDEESYRNGTKLMPHADLLSKFVGKLEKSYPKYADLQNKVVSAHLDLDRNMSYGPMQQLKDLYSQLQQAAPDIKEQVQKQIETIRNAPVRLEDSNNYAVNSFGNPTLSKAQLPEEKTYGQLYDTTVAHSDTINEKTPELNKKWQELSNDRDAARQLANYTGKDMGYAETFEHSMRSGFDNMAMGIAKASMTDAQRMDFYRRKMLVDNFILPKEQPAGIAGSAVNALGGLAPLALGTVAATAAGGPGLGGVFLGSIAGGAMMGLGEAGAGEYEGFVEAKNQGQSDVVAMDYAKKMSLERGATGTLLGAALPGMGGLGEKLLLNPLEKNVFKKFLAQQSVMAPSFGGNQMAQNIFSQYINPGLNRDALDNVTEAIGSSIALGGMMDALHLIPDLPAKTKQVFNMALADHGPSVSMAVNKAVQDGILDYASGQKIVEGVDNMARDLSQMPADLNPEEKLKVQPLIAQVNDLEKQKEATNPAFHSGIDAQIEDLHKEIREQLGSPLTDKEQKLYHDLSLKREDARNDPEAKRLSPLEKEQLSHLEKRQKEVDAREEKAKQDAEQSKPATDEGLNQMDNKTPAAGEVSKGKAGEQAAEDNTAAGKGDESNTVTIGSHATDGKDRLVSGKTGDPLTDAGKNEASNQGHDLKKAGVTTIITPSETRNAETAQILSDRTGANVETNDNFSPLDIGDFNGMKEKDFAPIHAWFVEHPDATKYEPEDKGDPHYGKSMGESINQHAEKVAKGVEDVKNNYPDDKVHIVANSYTRGVIDAIEKNGGWNDKAREDYKNNPKPDDISITKNSTNEKAQPGKETEVLKTQPHQATEEIPYITKNGKYKVFPEKGGGITVRDLDGNEVPNRIKGAYLREFKDNYKYDNGKDAEGAEHGDIESVIDVSNNPAEIAAIIHAEPEHIPADERDYKEQAINEFLGKVSRESFIEHNDKNNITKEIEKTHFAKTGGQRLDQVAQEAEENYYGNYDAEDPRITPGDVAEFIVNYPNKGDFEKQPNPVLQKARNKFIELTGLDPDPKTIKLAADEYTNPNRQDPKDIRANQSRENAGASKGAGGNGKEVPETLPGKEGEVAQGPDTTGTKNAITDKELSDLGMNPIEKQAVKSIPETWNKVKDAVDTGKVDPMQIVDKALQDEHPQFTDEDHFAILYQKGKIKNEIAPAYEKLAAATKAGDEAGKLEAMQKVAKLKDDFFRISEALKKAGSEWGRAGRFRQEEMADDYSLVANEARTRAANNGKELPADVSARIEALTKEHDAMQAKIKEHEEKIAKLEADKALQEKINEQLKEQAAAKTQSFTQKAKKAADDFRKLKSAPIVFKDANGNEINISGPGLSLAPKIWNDAIEIGAKAIELSGNVADGVKATIDHLKDQDWYKELSAPDKKAVNGQVEDHFESHKKPAKSATEVLSEKIERPTNISDLSAGLKRRMKELVEAGEKDHAVITGRIFNEVKDLYKKAGRELDFTETDIRNELSDYGKVRRPSQDEIDKQIRDLNAKMRLASSKEDVLSGKAPLKSGFQRDEQSPEILALQKEIKNLMREKGLDNSDLTPEERWRTALEAYKKRTQTRIDDLQKRIDTGDFAKRTRTPIELDKEGMELKAKAARLREKIDLEAEKLRLKNAPSFDKNLNWAVKWKRFAILSGYKTLAKLASAGLEQSLLFTPLRKIIQTGLGKIPGISSIADKAPGEGRISVKGLAENYAQFFKKATWDDVIKTAKTGKSDLDAIHGKERPEVRDFTDIPGSIHAAIKTLPKRAEYFSSVQTRAEYALRNGEHLTDPEVQQKIHAAAYDDAVRNVFMNKNEATTMYQTTLHNLESKGTGGKIVAALLRVDLPVVSVPTNLINDASSYIAGGLKAAWTLRGGVDALTERQADHVMRSLGKQTVGAIGMALAYSLYKSFGGFYERGQKRMPDEPKEGEVKSGNLTISKTFLHHPGIYAMMFSANIERLIQDHKAENEKRKADGKPEKPFSLPDALLHTITAVTKDVPFLEAPSRTAEEFKDTKSLTKTAGEGVKSFVEPQLMQNAAKDLDGNQKRYPQTFLEQMKNGVPGLRQSSSHKPDPAEFKEMDAKKQLKVLSGLQPEDAKTLFPQTQDRSKWVKLHKDHPELFDEQGEKVYKMLVH